MMSLISYLCVPTYYGVMLNDLTFKNMFTKTCYLRVYTLRTIALLHFQNSQDNATAVDVRNITLHIKNIYFGTKYKTINI